MNDDQRRRLHEEVRTRLQRALNPVSLELIDESHLHQGHGATGAHLRLILVSSRFVNEALMNRHRLVFKALAGLLPDTIHALSMQLYSPEEEGATPGTAR